MHTVPLETLTFARFKELLRTCFQVEIRSKDAVELRLVDVTAGNTVAKSGTNLQQYENFSVLFQGAQTRPLPQGTYRFEHPLVGSFDLFIVPVAAENGMIHYQAVFNRLGKPA